jgi:CheY-like chemotaxis protein
MGTFSEEKKILLIDDDADIVKTIRIFLEKEGYKVIEAFAGQEGLQKARETLPDLVVLDIEMFPGIRGPQVLRKLKDDPATQDIPILFLTGRVDLDGMEQAVNEEAEGYILKPIAILDLLKKIEDILEIER